MGTKKSRFKSINFIGCVIIKNLANALFQENNLQPLSSVSGIGKDTGQTFPVPDDFDMATIAIALDFELAANYLEVFSGFA